MGWIRAVLAASTVMASLAWAAPALAQDDLDPEPIGVTIEDDVDEAQPESSVVRDEDTSATVRRIRRDLIAVAGVMAVALVVYMWHTSPPRRLRAASARAEALLETRDED